MSLLYVLMLAIIIVAMVRHRATAHARGRADASREGPGRSSLP
jgi:hypothetical protein